MDTSYLDWLMTQQEEVAAPSAGPSEGGIWVVADVRNAVVAPVALEALGMARTLADRLGAYVYGVLLGGSVSQLAAILFQAGANGVHVAEHPSLACFGLEPYVQVLANLFEAGRPELVIFGATAQGQELAPRLAQRMGGGLIERVTTVGLDEATRTVQAAYPVYGGEYFEIAACPEARPQFLTVEPGAFPAPFLDTHRGGEAMPVEVRPVPPAVRVLGPADGFEPPRVPLSEAPLIVAAGRQVGDFGMVKRYAAALHAQVAGDRGARDAGWIGPERVVDVRGVRVAPQVYVALGIRGDTFHNAAIEEAGFVLAVHPDPDASIFQVADLCLQAKPEDVLPALLEALGA